MSDLLTGYSPNDPKNKPVKYLKKVSDLFTGQLPNVPIINPVKYHTCNQFISKQQIAL